MEARPMNNFDPVEMARLDALAKQGFAAPDRDLTAKSEAYEESKGKVYGGISGHQGHAGAWMSQKQMRELVDRFVKAGRSREDVIEALQGSGYDVSGLK
jgi:hypothetical protein